jgi:phosphoglycerol transferase MdoB-like AlkP superfamily enzyme
LGEFIKEAKRQDWYRNTLFVFVADHGYYADGAYEMPISYHHIPFVLHKPDALRPDTNHNLGYQPDILSTVAALMNIEFKNGSFGVNILKQKHPFVFFTADDKIGCVSDDGYYFYDLLSQKTRRLRRYPQYEEKDYYSEKKTKADSLEKSAKTMLKAAEFFIRRDYFSY